MSSCSAWIGSIQVRILIFCSCGSSPLDQFTLFLLPALISGRLFDLGYFRSTLILASINLIVCTVLVAECHEFWQLLLCQGFGVGVSLHNTILLFRTSFHVSVISRYHVVWYLDPL